MKKNKKVSLSKKPFLVLSRRAIAGWLAVIFILCAWMFVIGVLVGRGTAPLKFDIDGLQSKLEISGQDLLETPKGPAGAEPDMVKDKSKLDFYEALPEDREDTKIAEKKSDREVNPEVEQPPAKKLTKTIEEKAAKKSAPEKEAGEKSGSAINQPAKPSPTQPLASKSEAKPSGKVYTIQVSAVKVAADADRLVAQLNQKGYPAYRTISKVEGKGIWFRVRVGKYKSRADARAMVQRLKKAGMETMTVEVEQ